MPETPLAYILQRLVLLESPPFGSRKHALCPRVGSTPVRESRNTRPLRLCFRAMLSESSDRSVRLDKASNSLQPLCKPELSDTVGGPFYEVSPPGRLRAAP